MQAGKQAKWTSKRTELNSRAGKEGPSGFFSSLSYLPYRMDGLVSEWWEAEAGPVGQSVGR